MDRLELMAEIEARWQELDSLVSAFTDEDWRKPVAKEDPDADEWVAADAIAHIAAWKQQALRVAMQLADPAAAQVDETPNRVLGFDFNEFNREVLLEWRDQPTTSVLARHRVAHHGLVAALDSLPGDRLLLAGRPRRWLRPVLNHVGDHLEALQEAVGRH